MSKPTIQPEMVIKDLNAYKALTHPLRIQLIELLLQGEANAKQLAEKLESPLTKLYYHINLLAKHDLIQVSHTEVVSGIIEKWYLPSARLYRVDRVVLALDPSMQRSMLEQGIKVTLDEAKSRIFTGVVNGEIELNGDESAEKQLILERRTGTFTPEQIQLFHQTIRELLDTFEGSYQDALNDDESRQTYEFTVAVYPSPSVKQELAET